MLTQPQRQLIKHTIPLLEQGGETLTRHFYQNLLDEQPGVRPLFNQAHQADGRQARALANGVLTYARNIEHLEGMGELATQIIHKHVALQVQPEHYPIVGTYLLRSIRDVLGPEVATDAVLEAWRVAYQQLADLLITAERQAYDAIAAQPGGWRGARAFRVARKIPESEEITSFYLEPLDGGAVYAGKPGQYLGLQLEINGEATRRNYSLSQAANEHGYRISVKREPKGKASNFLHDKVLEGDVLALYPPAGRFTLVTGTTPLVMLSAGVGITPLLALAEAALVSGRSIVFICYARNPRVQAFRSTLAEWQAKYPQFKAYMVYEDPEGQPADATGRPEPAQLKPWLPAGGDFDAYFTGPKPFMACIKTILLATGLAETRLHYEFFGPAEALN